MKKIKKIAMKILSWIGNTVLFIFGIAIFALVVKMICVFVIIGIWIVNAVFGGETEEIYQFDFQIEAMKDNHTYVQGRYSGDSELKYYFVRETNGRLHTGSTDAYDSYIVEDGGNTVEVYAEYPEYGKKFFMIVEKWASFDGEPMGIKSYEYHIPEGTVDRDYEVDLE